MDLRKYSSISRYFLPFFRSSGLFRLASRATYTMLHSAKRTNISIKDVYKRSIILSPSTI